MRMIRVMGMLLAIHLGRIRDLSTVDGGRLLSALAALPEQTESIINREPEIAGLAEMLLGCEHVIAFDNDVDAYGALRDNRMRNRAEYEIFIGSVEALRGGAFDVITMNIIPEVILPLLKDVVSRMADGARLILSGILTARKNDVVEAALGHGLELVRERDKGEWWVGVFTR